MINDSLSTTRTLTGRLAIFFTAMSCVIGIVMFGIFYFALQWSEDRVGERRILIDRDSAVERFLSGEQGQIRLDSLTVAYNDLQLVPSQFRHYIQDYPTYLGEVATALSPGGHMLYKGHYVDNGTRKTIVLLSLVDQVEFGNEETLYSGLIVIVFVSLLMFTFGTLLFRLSKRLIEPVNDITRQLNEHLSGDTFTTFTMDHQAADEFQLLTRHLNQYREELQLAIKREQAFARYASHELRTPLTVVKGANKLLSRKEHSSFQHRQIRRIEDATTDMATMIDALLSIVRYERNVSDAPLRTVDPNEFESIVAANSAYANDKSLQIDIDIKDCPQLRATPAVLNMVLGNLIRNAIAACEQGVLTIKVSATKIEVIDDGVGLSETPDSDGHGLGLLIVRDLCRRYQWQFELSNHPTRGCVASIKF
ncbi:HAMP domain-containing histidine kinase [Vibrio sp. JPW-9-11-11]|uniref:sensor histidine kinase n=1 Tax=Vibrio sp. JPW-9-11-11 TaxID=1416532 RepID=UPI0015932AC7|nr:HAMP domain-containing sensor histidine kinase [Vibrio sp. JPW-9-11-11]NVD06345.1 HAMP domain-containing histidine kinase [Vibrio sp. JPW-9-11-11]